MTFQVQAPLEQEKLKTGPIWLDLLAETYLHFFGVHFLSFPMSTAKQCFGLILTTFPGLGTTRAAPQKAKLITRPEWPGFAPETYPHCLGCSSYRLSSLLLKTVLVEFWRLFRARALLEQLKRKIGPRWLSFTPETYPHSLWCSSYRFQSVQLKHVSAEFWWVFKPVYHNSWQSWKYGPEDSILHPKHTNTLLGCNSYHFSAVRSKKISVKFWRLFRSGH